MAEESIAEKLIPLAVRLGLTETELMQAARKSVVETGPDEMDLLKDRYSGYQALAENIIYMLPDTQKPAADIALQLYCAVMYAERGMKAELADTLWGVLEYAGNLTGTSHDHEAFPDVLRVCGELLRQTK